jgi:hypothetical protein
MAGKVADADPGVPKDRRRAQTRRPKAAGGAARGRAVKKIPARRGRPDGSVKLTPEIEQVILQCLVAGMADFIAAEFAGIDERTFRDWVCRGEGRHPTRSCTPQLRSFARAVMRAKAQGRGAREIDVAQRSPQFWLTHMARSKPGREGWTEPIEDPTASQMAVPIYQPSLEEAAETLRALIEAGVISIEDAHRSNTDKGGGSNE